MKRFLPETGKWRRWVFACLLLVPAAGWAGLRETMAENAISESPPEVSFPAVQENPSVPSGSDDPISVGGDLKKEKDKKRLKFLLVVNLVFIIVIFTFFLIFSLIRFSRFQRLRLQIGKKTEPTAYVDAWSQYRLDEKDIEPGPLGDGRETDTDNGK